MNKIDLQSVHSGYFPRPIYWLIRSNCVNRAGDTATHPRPHERLYVEQKWWNSSIACSTRALSNSTRCKLEDKISGDNKVLFEQICDGLAFDNVAIDRNVIAQMPFWSYAEENRKIALLPQQNRSGCCALGHFIASTDYTRLTHAIVRSMLN